MTVYEFYGVQIDEIDEIDEIEAKALSQSIPLYPPLPPLPHHVLPQAKVRVRDKPIKVPGPITPRCMVVPGPITPRCMRQL